MSCADLLFYTRISAEDRDIQSICACNAALDAEITEIKATKEEV